MASFQGLLQLLQKELKHQEKLLVLLKKEHETIVRLDQAELDKLQETKDKLVNQAFELEGRRTEVIERLMSEAKLETPIEKMKLSDLLEHCTDKSISSALKKVGAELKSITVTVKELNKKNGDLLKQSLGLIATTLSIMHSRPGTDLPTYGKTKKLTSTASDPAFAVHEKSFTRAV